MTVREICVNHKYFIEGEIILVKLKQNPITKKRIAEAFAESFADDPLYVHMLPEKETREEVLKIFFKIYIDIYGKYGDVVATSDDLCSLGYIYYADRPVKRSIFIKDCISGGFHAIDFLRYIPLKQVINMMKTLNVMSSAWIGEMTKETYIHLDLIVVKPEHRGQGKSKQILNYVIHEANKEGKILTLETQNPQNVALYEHFGFDVKNTIAYDGMIQYCMVKQPESN